jgi:diguanylate cyclase (GGDEF)-like protein
MRTQLLSKKELENLRLLRGVDLDAFEGLIRSCPVRRLRPGDVIIEAGKANKHLYLLVSGRLRVHLLRDDEPVAVLGPGEAVGEISLIDGQPASANVVADEESRVLQLDARLLWSLVRSSHTAAFNLLLILAQRLRSDNSVITRTRQLQREWERCATLDGLTGLYNRRWLDSTLPKLAARCRAAGTPLSVIAIDLDGFKQYNDTFGHPAGDRALFSVALSLQKCLRPGDLLARHGGDEFLALLPNAELSITRQVAKRLHRDVSATPITASDGTPLPPVAISLGFAQLHTSGTLEQLMKEADEALYRAKNGGRNRISD